MHKVGESGGSGSGGTLRALLLSRGSLNTAKVAIKKKFYIS